MVRQQEFAKTETTRLAGRYRIDAELGRGGAGAVYRVLDEASGRTMALKTLERNSPELVALFEREYHTLASLAHPRVIGVYDYGIADNDQRFYTMELLAGKDVVELAPLPWRNACTHIRDVAASLSLLHARRLLHRDVSPRNVRIDETGRAKLIDFGALCSFGKQLAIVGTPQCIAPEAVRKQALDQRTDVYSLGVTLYWALTGRVPYPIREIREAESAYAEPPVAPSVFAVEVPKALDQLVLAMVRVDPMERPASAAEVMERLSAIAQLHDEAGETLSESALRSSALVGREREKRQLHQHLGRTLRGQGAVVLLEGEHGIGRTRLAREMCVEASIAGVTSLRVDALAHPQPSGVMRALALALLRAAGADAVETLADHIDVLGQVFHELRAHCPPARESITTALPVGPAELRASVQNALVSWVLDVAKRRPLLVVIDDAEAADVNSAGALVWLAHSAQGSRLLLLATCNVTHEPSVAMQQLGRLAARIKLRSLENAAIDQLVEGVFGDVPDRGRLARWLCTSAHGNPGHTLGLIKHLVAQGIIRCEGGTYLLPREFSAHALPGGFGDALRARALSLSTDAQLLARALALHRGALSATACAALIPTLDESALAATLTQLTAADIVSPTDGGHRFAQEGMRSTLLDDVSPDELCTLHLRLGHALTSTHPELFDAALRNTLGAVPTHALHVILQTGWYFLRGGDGKRGRALLRKAGTELAIRGDGLVEAVPALETALEAYRREGRSRYECIPLLGPLTLAGLYVDFRLGYRYADEVIETMCDVTGVARARRLERWLGQRLALYVSIAIALLLFATTSRRRAAHSFAEAFLSVVGMSSAVIGVCTAVDDRERAERIMAAVRPLGAFPVGHPARLAYELQQALVACTAHRFGQSTAHARRLLAEVRDPALKGLPPVIRQQFELGILSLLGPLDTLCNDGPVRESLDACDGLQTATARQVAAGVRTQYHGHRGERVQYLKYIEEVDVLAAQAGSTWRQDLHVPRLMWHTFFLCEDVMGLKRCAQQLETWLTACPWAHAQAASAMAAYLLERGMHTEVLSRYGVMFEQWITEHTATSMRYVAVYARALRASGQAGRAREICMDALRNIAPDELAFTSYTFGVRLESPLALAELGALHEAEHELALLLAEQSHYDNPLLLGLTHKACARVAMLRGDADTFERHLKAMESWFRKAENPALVAQCQRLSDEGRDKGVLSHVVPLRPRQTAHAERKSLQVRTVFDGCRGPAERLQAALDLMVEQSGAERGYLYLLDPSGLRFAAPNVGLEPPESLRADLTLQMARHRAGEAAAAEPGNERGSTLGETTVMVADEDSNTGPTLRASRCELLLVPRTGDMVVVGAVALVDGGRGLLPLSRGFVEEIARGIYGAGDICTVYLAAPAFPAADTDRASGAVERRAD